MVAAGWRVCYSVLTWPDLCDLRSSGVRSLTSDRGEVGVRGQTSSPREAQVREPLHRLTCVLTGAPPLLSWSRTSSR